MSEERFNYETATPFERLVADHLKEQAKSEQRKEEALQNILKKLSESKDT